MEDYSVYKRNGRTKVVDENSWNIWFYANVI